MENKDDDDDDELESILDGHLSRLILPAPFRLEIENTN